MNPPPHRLSHRAGIASRAQSVLLKVTAIICAGIMLIGAFALSIVFVAAAIVVLSVVGGYVWWKTRHLRRQMKAQFAQGEIIEGVVIRETEVRRLDERPRD